MVAGEQLLAAASMVAASTAIVDSWGIVFLLIFSHVWSRFVSSTGIKNYYWSRLPDPGLKYSSFVLTWRSRLRNGTKASSQPGQNTCSVVVIEDIVHICLDPQYRW